jgi:hypothetical protein
MRLAPTLLVSVAALAAGAYLACHSSQADLPAATAPAPANSIQGSVLEVLPASPYTYLRLKAAQGEVWAAVPTAEVKVGDPVTVQVQVRMDKFQSSSLHRTFDAVYMGTLAGAAPAAPGVQAAPGAPGAPSYGTIPAAPIQEKVAKAKGADTYTIAELYAKRKDLKDRSVTVKGRVTRCIGGIMGRTWIHLADGSGQTQSKDFDLAVTSQEGAKVGDVVTVKGVLHVDKDFGAGYAYPVIVEDAKIVP